MSPTHGFMVYRENPWYHLSKSSQSRGDVGTDSLSTNNTAIGEPFNSIQLLAPMYVGHPELILFLHTQARFLLVPRSTGASWQPTSLLRTRFDCTFSTLPQGRSCCQKLTTEFHTRGGRCCSSCRCVSKIYYLILKLICNMLQYWLFLIYPNER